MYLLCGSFCFTIYLWTGALKVYKNNLFLFSRGGGCCCWWVFYFKYYSETIFFNTTGKRETIPTQWPSKYIFTWGALSCLSKRTNFNSDFYETFLFKSRANITCSDLHDAIAVSPDTTCSSTRTWFHMSIMTCTNKYMFTICNEY